MSIEEKKLSTPAERLKYLRLILKLTQADFANALEIKQQRLSNYEKGDRKIPNDILERLSKTWNVNINWLVTGIGDPLDTVSMISNDSIKQVTDAKELYINRSQHNSAGSTIDKQKAEIWFENLPESDQIGLLFKVIYRWSREGKILLHKTLNALIGDE
ncbi:helix-turn-helix domain-containing protein [candidate division KSB1 bacterium]|nr:helix-turn-helix domain-containing protein [candidate division KSB1 bacterium]